MTEQKRDDACGASRSDAVLGANGKRYLNNWHEWDEDGCCIHCGFDGAEYLWWRRDTYEGRAMATEMPKCTVPNTGVTGA